VHGGALGCTFSPSAPPCTGGFLGDPSLAPQLQILVVKPDDSVVPAVDGGSVALMAPPQGGFVIYAGVRAKNVDRCGLQLTGALRDPVTNQVRPEMRTIDLTPTSDGWGVSSTGPANLNLSNFSNLPACPNNWSTADVFGQSYELEVAIEDKGGRSASQTLVVTPYCDPAATALCMCRCAAGYVLGEPCSDGG
jgi:hypothetical protein